MEFLGIGSRIKHPAFGEGVIIRLHVAAYEVCFTQFGIKMVGKEYNNWQVIEQIPVEESVSFSEAEKALVKILRAWSGVSLEKVELGDRWKGGMLILKPGSEELKPKEIPISTFFHKVIMIRDRLRVLEQRINSSEYLQPDDKVNLQQYITRIYGSLTTFNVLFKDKDDYFVGERSE